MAEVLIVEPRTQLGRDLARVLTDRGHAVVTAQDAEEALDLAGSTHPTVVLVDSSVPEIPALDLVRVFRHVPPFHQAWIAAVGEHAPPVRPGDGAGLNASVTGALGAEALVARLAACPGSPLGERRDPLLGRERSAGRGRPKGPVNSDTALGAGPC